MHRFVRVTALALLWALPSLAHACLNTMLEENDFDRTGDGRVIVVRDTLGSMFSRNRRSGVSSAAGPHGGLKSEETHGLPRPR